jgi:dipeptidyl-peptidase-4
MGNIAAFFARHSQCLEKRDMVRKLRLLKSSPLRALPALGLAISLTALGGLSLPHALAQDRLPTMPGYEQYSQAGKKYQQAQQLLSEGSVYANWIEDGKAFEFYRAGKKYRYDVASNATTEVPPPPAEQAVRAGRRAPLRERGRQFDFADSPDKKRRALYRDNNVWLGDAEGNNAVQITTRGSRKTDQVRHG